MLPRESRDGSLLEHSPSTLCRLCPQSPLCLVACCTRGTGSRGKSKPCQKSSLQTQTTVYSCTRARLARNLGQHTRDTAPACLNLWLLKPRFDLPVWRVHSSLAFSTTPMDGQTALPKSFPFRARAGLERRPPAHRTSCEPSGPGARGACRVRRPVPLVQDTCEWPAGVI